MTPRGGWLRLLLLAGLLAWPRLAVEPVGTLAPASLRSADAVAALAAPQPPTVRLLPGTQSGGAATHKGPMHALPVLPPTLAGAVARPAAADLPLPGRSAVRGAGHPRFPTGPPATLPLA
jgi:hypothetical protein